MVDQRGQLIDALAQPPLGTEVTQESEHLSNHEESVAIGRVVPRLLESNADVGEDLRRRLLENEVVRGGAEHPLNLVGSRGPGAPKEIRSRLGQGAEGRNPPRILTNSSNAST